MSAKTREADSNIPAFAGVGVKVMMTVQVPAAVTGLATAQVPPVMTKSPAFAPVTMMLVKFSVTFPVFVRVTVICTLAGLTGTEAPKETLGGSPTVTPVPAPESGSDWVAGEALSAKLSVAVSAIGGTDGENRTVTVQLNPTAIEFALPVRQVVEVIVKSAAFVPVIPGLLENVNEPDPDPQFVSVTVREALEPRAS